DVREARSENGDPAGRRVGRRTVRSGGLEHSGERGHGDAGSREQGDASKLHWTLLWLSTAYYAADARDPHTLREICPRAAVERTSARSVVRWRRMRVGVIRTPFTELIGIEHPVVCAGMGG